MHQTPVKPFHAEHGATMVDFAGWEMPIRFAGVIDEHRATRASGGVFDVSHMGRVELSGVHAKRLLERTCTRRIGDMKLKRCRYGLVCNDRGGVMDDIVVSRTGDSSFMVVVNGVNREKILRHWESVAEDRGFKVKIDDKTFKTAMLAVQGPRVMELISSFSKEIPSLKRWSFTEKNLLVIKVTVSRTGYTGEDGVEVIFPSNSVPMLMKVALSKMDPKDPDAPLKPCGLAARDTLRIEAGLPLYGHEISEDISALSLGMDFAVSLDKSEAEDGETFIGQEALLAEREAGGPPRVLVGLALEGRRTARQGAAVTIGERGVGTVTSGCLSPTLDRSVAMALVERDAAAIGTSCEVAVGSSVARAAVTPRPFYTRPAG